MRPVTRHPHVQSALQGEPLEGTIHPSVGASPRKSQKEDTRLCQLIYPEGFRYHEKQFRKQIMIEKGRMIWDYQRPFG